MPPVPSSFSDFDVTPATNSPQGTEPAKGNIDNYLRTAFAFIKQNYNAILGKAANGANSDITSLSGLTTALSVAQGGTGGKDAVTARTNLGLATVASSGSASDLVTGTLLAGRLPTATTAAVGGVQLATNAQAQAGTDAGKVVTPAALSAVCLGMGQTWQSMIGSRAFDTNYTNNTGRTISVMPTYQYGTTADILRLFINGSQVQVVQGNTTYLSWPQLGPVLIPPGATYKITRDTANGVLFDWQELR